MEEWCHKNFDEKKLLEWCYNHFYEQPSYYGTYIEQF